MWCSRLRIQCCYSCGAGWIPGLGTSVSCECGKNKNKNKNKTKQEKWWCISYGCQVKGKKNLHVKRSKCKGPVAGVCLACLVSVAGVDELEGTVVGEGHCEAPAGHHREFGFYPGSD